MYRELEHTVYFVIKLPKFYSRLSLFSQWLKYIFMGISKTRNMELRNNEISKTYLLQIVQIVTCSIVIILYLPCNSSAWRITAMDRTAAGEH